MKKLSLYAGILFAVLILSVSSLFAFPQNKTKALSWSPEIMEKCMEKNIEDVECCEFWNVELNWPKRTVEDEDCSKYEKRGKITLFIGVYAALNVLILLLFISYLIILKKRQSETTEGV